MAEKKQREQRAKEEISSENAPDFIRVPIGNVIGRFFNIPKILRRLKKEGKIAADVETSGQDTSDE